MSEAELGPGLSASGAQIIVLVSDFRHTGVPQSALEGLLRPWAPTFKRSQGHHHFALSFGQ